MKKKMLLVSESAKKHKIRNVLKTDLDEILKIEKACYPEPWTRGMFLQEIENPVARFICYEQDRHICGYLCYWNVAGEVEILNLATARHMQRQGVARTLLAHAFDQEGQQDLASAFLEVRSSNSGAFLLYRRNGFRQIGVRRNYYRNGEDAILMMKTFDS